MAHQGAGVDPLDADDAVLLQISVETHPAAPVAREVAGLLDHESGEMGPGRFDVLEVDAVVADQRIGHGDDLAGVGRIGQNFLVARHAGVEDDLAGYFSGSAEGLADEILAVGQGENGFHACVSPYVRSQQMVFKCTEQDDYLLAQD